MQPFVGYDLCCFVPGRIEEITPNEVLFSCGYKLAGELPKRAKHFGEQFDEVIDDGDLDGFL